MREKLCIQGLEAMGQGFAINFLDSPTPRKQKAQKSLISMAGSRQEGPLSDPGYRWMGSEVMAPPRATQIPQPLKTLESQEVLK